MGNDPVGGTERRGIGAGWESQHGRRTATAQASFFLPYLKPGMKVLDCGCGPGSITLGLAAFVQGGSVIGIDIDEERIAQAEALVSTTGSRNVTFEKCDIYSLPFPDNHFDAAYEHAVLEHLDDPRTAVDEISRVLKPGGIFGASDRIIGASIFAPEYPDDAALLHEHLDMVRRYRQSTGSDLNFGMRLFALLQEAGFQDVSASVSEEVYWDSENKRSAIDSAIGRVSASGFGDFIIQEIGDERLRGQLAALQRLAQSPKGWSCEFNGEAVGKKSASVDGSIAS